MTTTARGANSGSHAIAQLKLRLETSEKGLLAFAQKEQIVVVTEKASIAEDNLASANGTHSALAAERIKNEQLWRQVEAATNAELERGLTAVDRPAGDFDVLRGEGPLHVVTERLVATSRRTDLLPRTISIVRSTWARRRKADAAT